MVKTVLIQLVIQQDTYGRIKKIAQKHASKKLGSYMSKTNCPSKDAAVQQILITAIA